MREKLKNLEEKQLRKEDDFKLERSLTKQLKAKVEESKRKLVAASKDITSLREKLNNLEDERLSAGGNDMEKTIKVKKTSERDEEDTGGTMPELKAVNEIVSYDNDEPHFSKNGSNMERFDSTKIVKA